jgi:hypothetical protein
MSRSTSLFTRIRLLAAALALPALFGAVPAQANVRTTIPGAACYVDPFFANPGGVIFVEGNGGYRVGTEPEGSPLVSTRTVCPITRSLPLTTDGMSDFEIRFVSNSDEAGQAWCTLASVRPDGTILQSAGKTQTIPGNAQTTMDLGAGITKSASKGTYFFSCLVPQTVQLLSVYHSENDGVSGN